MQPSNDHNVYILGAGVSVAAGLPMVSNFMEKMRICHPWLLEKGRKAEAQAITKVLEFRLQSAAAAYWIQMDLDNIEELFSLAAAYPDQMGSHVRLAIGATLDYARLTSKADPLRIHLQDESSLKLMKNWCVAETPPNAARADRYLMDPYRMWIARLIGLLNTGKPTGRNTFITFNYDTILEDALEAIGVDYSYGFDPSEVTFEAGATGSNTSSSVTVLKVHGSLNWARTPGSKITEVKTSIFPSYRALRKGRLYPQLVPPTWKKSFQRQSSAIMTQAVEKLESATRVIVSGFSMPATDVHFKYMLAAGFAKNISLRKVIFVSPTTDELKMRAQAHFKDKFIENGRIEFIKSTFGSAAGDWGFLGSIDRPHPNKISYSIET